MTIGYQTEKEGEKKIPKREARRGTKTVIAGSLASILLWFSVSILGKSIASAGAYSSLYLAALSAPAILVAVLAIHNSKRQN